MVSVTSASPLHALVVRRMGFPFDGVPRYWFGNSAFRTHLINGINFVFPAGERFFIRSVNHYSNRVSKEMRERIRGFAGQEAMHQVEHLRFFATLEHQGYEIQSFIEWYERVAYDFIEQRFPPEVRLATTAALEHYTASMGEFALSSGLLDAAHDQIRDLLMWHAAEEIEHKSVAYDLLMEVDPRYRTRLKGFMIGTPGLSLLTVFPQGINASPNCEYCIYFVPYFAAVSLFFKVIFSGGLIISRSKALSSSSSSSSYSGSEPSISLSSPKSSRVLSSFFDSNIKYIILLQSCYTTYNYWCIHSSLISSNLCLQLLISSAQLK